MGKCCVFYFYVHASIHGPVMETRDPDKMKTSLFPTKLQLLLRGPKVFQGQGLYIIPPESSGSSARSRLYKTFPENLEEVQQAQIQTTSADFS